MTFRLGLTGSIGMGKTTTARLFEELGCAVWDADEAVHRLYGKGGLAVEPLRDLFPDVIVDEKVSRERLKSLIFIDKSVLEKLESTVHPLVQKDRLQFTKSARSDVIVFDIPLLFETGSDKEMDATACVFVSPEVQRERVLTRGTMTAQNLDTILARQMPSEEKCARATYVIETDSLEHARVQVLEIFNEITNRQSEAF